MGIVGNHARQAYAQTLAATTGIQVFGTPTENNLRMLRQQAGSGVSAGAILLQTWTTVTSPRCSFTYSLKAIRRGSFRLDEEA
jgi:hypothetical protein